MTFHKGVFERIMNTTEKYLVDKPAKLDNYNGLMTKLQSQDVSNLTRNEMCFIIDAIRAKSDDSLKEVERFFSNMFISSFLTRF